MQLSLYCYVAHLTASAAAAYGNTLIQGAGITAFAGTQVHCRTLQHFALHTPKIAPIAHSHARQPVRGKPGAQEGSRP